MIDFYQVPSTGEHLKVQTNSFLYKTDTFGIKKWGVCPNI